MKKLCHVRRSRGSGWAEYFATSLEFEPQTCHLQATGIIISIWHHQSSDPIPQWQTLGQVRLRHRWSAGPSLQTMGLFGPDCFRSITRPTAASVFATLRATASNVLVLYHCREKESQLAATVQANNSRGDSLGTPTAPIHTHTHTRATASRP